MTQQKFFGKHVERESESRKVQPRALSYQNSTDVVKKERLCLSAYAKKKKKREQMFSNIPGVNPKSAPAGKYEKSGNLRDTKRKNIILQRRMAKKKKVRQPTGQMTR